MSKWLNYFFLLSFADNGKRIGQLHQNNKNNTSVVVHFTDG